MFHFRIFLYKIATIIYEIVTNYRVNGEESINRPNSGGFFLTLIRFLGSFEQLKLLTRQAHRELIPHVFFVDNVCMRRC